MRRITEDDVIFGKARLDEMGFYCVTVDYCGQVIGTRVSKFLARSCPDRAIRLGLEKYPHLWDKAKVKEVVNAHG